MKLCTLGVFALGELGFLNCDDIVMCVVNKQFGLLKFVFDSAYVDLQYVLLLLGLCPCSGCLWSVCEVVVVPYVDAVVAVTVIRVRLFVLHEYILRKCEGHGNAGMGDGGVVLVNAGHVGGTRGIVSSAAVVLGMSVVHGMRGFM